VKCSLCGREAASDELCSYHAEAKKRLQTAYRAWKEAYGTLAWDDYLRGIIRNTETGPWVVEVAKSMLQQDHSSQGGSPG
jgi:hypothetical protein